MKSTGYHVDLVAFCMRYPDARLPDFLLALIEAAPPGEAVTLYPASEFADLSTQAWVGAIFEAMGCEYPWTESRYVRQLAYARAARFGNATH
jgi:hypothetical protein